MLTPCQIMGLNKPETPGFRDGHNATTHCLGSAHRDEGVAQCACKVPSASAYEAKWNQQTLSQRSVIMKLCSPRHRESV